MIKRWLKSRKVRIAGILLLLAFIALNVSAFLHARAMTHFIKTSEKTLRAEKLSVLGKIRVLITGVKAPRPENSKTPKNSGLDYETIHFTGAHGLWIESWLVTRPSPKGIVLMFHGYGGSKESLLDAAKEFHSMGHDTLLVDFHGAGGSDGNVTSIGFSEADDVIAAFASAKKAQPQRPIILFGASVGAVAILRAIYVSGIQPDALILECPFDRLLTTAKNRFAVMHMPTFPFAQLLVFWGGAQQGFNGFKLNPVEYARSVRCPTLLMNGEADKRVTVEQAKSIFKNLGGAKTFKTFPGLEHESYLASQPEEWKSAVEKFLRDNQNSGGTSSTSP